MTSIHSRSAFRCIQYTSWLASSKVEVPWSTSPDYGTFELIKATKPTGAHPNGKWSYVSKWKRPFLEVPNSMCKQAQLPWWKKLGSWIIIQCCQLIASQFSMERKLKNGATFFNIFKNMFLLLAALIVVLNMSCFCSIESCPCAYFFSEAQRNARFMPLQERTYGLLFSDPARGVRHIKCERYMI